MQDRQGFIIVPNALKNICLIGIKAGSHWTIKDVAGPELQQAQAHE
jgi:hypothetical protein